MKKKNEIIQAMKRGFTLVELLVVVAILGVLATVAIKNVAGYLDDADKVAAQESVKTLDETVGTYKMRYKKLPNSLRDLVEPIGDREPLLKGGEGVLVDPWKMDYKLEKTKTGFYVVSAGPDMQFGTEDDIRSDKVEKKKND